MLVSEFTLLDAESLIAATGGDGIQLESRKEIDLCKICLY